MHFDVVVVGGGIIGLSVALRSAQRGARVVVVDRGELGAGASRAAAGMIAPVSEADAAERELLELGLRSAAPWPAFAAEAGRRAAHRADRCSSHAIATRPNR